MTNIELDRLAAEMNAAWRRKEDAQQACDRAWQRRCDTRAPMQQAAKAKDTAYETQQESWRELRSLRDRHGPRIEQLNRQQETAYQNMRSAFDRASASHEARDGNAKYHADQGHEYKAEAQGYVAERRRLVEELQQATEKHNAVVAEFQRLKAAFDIARRPFLSAKAEHERCEEERKRCRQAFFAARNAFTQKLREVRGARARRNDDKRALAERAGVPAMYLDDVWISWQGDVVNIYFGGVGAPNGEGHGHYVMHISGKVTYRRDPGQQHGGHNFTQERTRPERDRRTKKESQPKSGGYFDDALGPFMGPASKDNEFDDALGPFEEEVGPNQRFDFDKTESYIAREREGGHKGGFLPPVHGWIDGQAVTASFGWGTREGETLLADGHTNASKFKEHDSHNHYGSGNGPRGNVKDRFRYSGPGA